MAGPITWRSITPTADANTAAQLLASSQRSINAAFDPFQKILADKNAFAGQQAGALREGNKQAFLDALDQAKTTEQLAALEASGQLNALLANLTPDNQAAVRGAGEARAMGLRQKLLGDQQFTEGQTLLAQRPVEDQLAMHLANGDFRSFDQTFADYPELLNKAKWASARAGATDKEVQRTQATEDRQHTLTGRETATELARINLDNARRTATEAEQRRAIDTKVNDFITTSQQMTGINRQEIERAATRYPGVLPRGVDGSIDPDQMTPEQRTSFNAFLTQVEAPTLDTISGGETKLKADLIQSLRNAGVPPTEIHRVDGMVSAGLSRAPVQAIGQDAERLALAAGQNQVAMEQQDAGNSWYAPGSDDAKNTYNELAKEVDTFLKAQPSSFSTGRAPTEDIPHVQALLGKLATEGIKVKVPGEKGEQEITVTPSANDFRRFLRSVPGGWWNDDARAKDIEKELKTWLNSSDGQSAVKKGLESQAYRGAQRVRQLQREYLNPGKK